MKWSFTKTFFLVLVHMGRFLNHLQNRRWTHLMCWRWTQLALETNTFGTGDDVFALETKSLMLETKTLMLETNALKIHIRTSPTHLWVAIISTKVLFGSGCQPAVCVWLKFKCAFSTCLPPALKFLPPALKYTPLQSWAVAITLCYSYLSVLHTQVTCIYTQ